MKEKKRNTGKGSTLYVILPIVLIGVTVFGRGFRVHRLHEGIIDARPFGVMQGEFEPQEALLLAWPLPTLAHGPEGRDGGDQVACDIVKALRRDVQIVVPACNESVRIRVTRQLVEADIPEDSVQFIPVPCNYRWIRDFGPACLKSACGSYALVDADYFPAGLANLHPQEDQFPRALGAYLGLNVLRAPIAIQHGNILSNGRGLCIMTETVMLGNHTRGYGEKEVAQVLRSFYGAEQVVFLERMRGEPTGHVDMFAAFTSPNTVVIGRYSQKGDPVNAAILDRNAARLAALEGAYGKLRVVRIPMPCRPRRESGVDLWPTHTNVIFGNRKLLVPIYPGLDAEAESAAISVFEELLPERDIVGIDASLLLPTGGSLHCATLNLFTLGNGDKAADDHQHR